MVNIRSSGSAHSLFLFLSSVIKAADKPKCFVRMDVYGRKKLALFLKISETYRPLIYMIHTHLLDWFVITIRRAGMKSFDITNYTVLSEAVLHCFPSGAEIGILYALVH